MKVSDVYKIGSYVLDLNKGSMHCDDSRHYIEFSESERRILSFLIKSEGNVKSQSELESVGWGGKPVSSSSLSVVITSLRKKLSHIRTIEIVNVPKMGYYIQSSVPFINLMHNDVGLEGGRLKKYNISSYLYIITNTVFIIIISVTFLLYGLFRVNYSCQSIKDKTICTIDKLNNKDIDILKKEGRTNVELIKNNNKVKVIVISKNGDVLNETL